MTPGPLNVRITRGSTAAAIVLWCYADPARTARANLTGFQAYAQVRKSASGEVVFDLAPTITDAAGGEVTIPEKSPTETSALVAGGYLWDLILQKPSGEVSDPIIAGSYVIREKISTP